MAVFTYDFTGADTAVGAGIPAPNGYPALEVISGSWRRLANKPSTDTAIASNPILAVTIGAGSVDETATVSPGGGDALYCRVTDATNWIRARINAWTTSVQIYHPVSTWVDTSYYTSNGYIGSGWVQNERRAIANYHTAGDEYSDYVNGIPTTHYYWSPYDSSGPGLQMRIWETQTVSETGYWTTQGYYRDDSYYTTDYVTHYQIILEKSVASVVTALQTSAEIVAPTSLRVLAVGSSIKVYYNSIGTALLSVTEAAFTNITKHGIGRGASENNIQGLDNFVIDSLSYPPNAVGLSPANGVGVTYAALTNFSWVFSDITPGIPQAAYQVIIERNDTGALIWDSGKIFTNVTSVSNAITVAYKDVALRWKVQVWDAESLSNGYSTYAIFTLTDGPVVIITSPTTVTSSSPILDWTYSSVAGRAQAFFRVKYTRQNAGSPSFDSGLISSSALTYTPPVTIFGNNQTFVVELTVTDTFGIYSVISITQLALYAVPATISNCQADESQYTQGGYVLISWPSAIPDAEFLAWRVYRRVSPYNGSFELVTEIQSVAVRNYQDWTIPANSTYQYYVTQVATRFNSKVESVPLGTMPTITVNESHYWLIDPLEPNNNLQLTVKSDNFSTEIEQSAYTIVGRGRHVDYGDDLGFTGSLTAQLRDNVFGTARSKLLKIGLLQKQKRMCYLRNPFGDIIPVAIGNISIDRLAGVGSSEFCDVTIPYLEVA